ncbi:nitrate transporter [Aetokthonos hydrillicola Thurmond2011]|uniref:Nitrate transporter n=1 Tax=Aetokthonos hydrillicola Thurmond2011 TaxID=2712845 RepID=A0AAP5I6X6_9CYAN|nr:nitrate transporter [Aetokthonos hydrillicola]MBO3458783.1 nitrate transporter [Aetokthonos hydrillicola CCALA 1050]MBW4585530.1 nitrate transporter [Aetokthonos hydrillicola CCALA 1050]MDR9896153.1 nitrate transporter [Aetokthonos hydrillicola Thurmond2011]
MEHSIFVDILTSVERLFVGYIPAAILGILIGLVVGINNIGYLVFMRILQIANSIPSIALLPIALLAFKQTEVAIWIVVFISALWTVIIDTAKGMRQFRTHGHNFRVAIPHIFRALRLGIWFAWVTVIAAEMLTGGQGLGYVIWGGYNNTSNKKVIIDALIYIGMIAFTLDQLLDITGLFLSQIVVEGEQRNR